VDKNKQIFSHIVEGVEDQGLVEMLDDFQVMYPYLKLIADENEIQDPFDEKVVEAYWIGNKLLEGVKLKGFWNHLMEGQQLKKRFNKKDLKWMVGKVPAGAKVHHSFHVFNIWNNSSHEAKPHTVETMDKCRIAWGEVASKAKDKIKVKTQELVYKDGKLSLKAGVIKDISWRIGDKKLIKGIKKEDLITFHWGWVCEKVSKNQIENLEKYTKYHLRLANLTI